MKTFTVTFLLTASCFAALGQGVVQFRTYYGLSTPPVNAMVTSCETGLPLDGPSNPLCRAALIGGPTTATPASWQTPGTLSMMYNPTITTLTWVNFRAAPNAGYVTVASPARVVPGVNWGQQAMVQMVVWQGNYNTWDEAYMAWLSSTPGILIGFSNPLTLTLPTGPTDQNLTYLTGLQPFCLGCLSCPYFNGFSGPNDVTADAGQSVSLQVWVDAWPPPLYEWYFNGNLVASDHYLSVYQIPSVQPADAGQYYVIISHVLGTFTSRTATLTVRVPPSITSAPQSQTAVTGSSAVFRVSATGDAPLTYQWYFNGSAPLGRGTSLKLAALQPQHVGAYTVVVGNAWGSVTSAPAMLNAIPPVDMALAPGVLGHAETGTALNLESADALASAMIWQPVTQLAVTNENNTTEAYIDWPRVSPHRFYRAWQTNGVSQPPLLSMQPIPAITLTGAVGSLVRIDYINQIGPTDAWVTLATVSLTNAAQGYFDTSAIGQPARLYRLVSGP